MAPPIRGMSLGMFVLTTVAQYAFMSQGSRYPVKPRPSVTRNRQTPAIHVHCRGALNAPEKKLASM